MSETLILYFDKIKGNGKVGETTDGEKILYNLHKIDPQKYKEYTEMLFTQDKSTIYSWAGRFLVIASASLELKEQEMVAMDMGSNEAVAQSFFKNDESIETIMHCFRNALVNKDKPVEIIEGTLPVLPTDNNSSF